MMELCNYCFGLPLVNEGYADCPECGGMGFVDYDEYEECEAE